MSIQQTIKEMLTDRGYTMKNDDVFTKENKEIHIKILDQKKIGKKEILTIIEEMEQENYNHLIIVIPQKLTPLAIQELKDIKDKEIEVFLYKELSFNITKHYTQPKITLLSTEEKKNLIKEIKASQLPILLKSDPVARYYNAKTGMIFKYERPSIYYRIVV